MNTEKKSGGLVQFVKYSLSGAAATSVHLVMFYIMAIWVLPSLSADDPVFGFLGMEAPRVAVEGLRARNAALGNTVAFVISNFTAYILNILFVFKGGRHHWLLEIGLFYLVSGVSLFIGTGIQTWLILKMGMVTTLAFGANMICSLAINYAMRKYVIFKG